MTSNNTIHIIGNLTGEPELSFTQSGDPVVNFTIASTDRVFDRATNKWKNADPLFLRASAWGELARHISASLTKGTRVTGTGRLKQRSYETKEGEKRTSIDLVVDSIGPDLRYATALVTRRTTSDTENTHAEANAAELTDSWPVAPIGQDGGER